MVSLILASIRRALLFTVALIAATVQLVSAVVPTGDVSFLFRYDGIVTGCDLNALLTVKCRHVKSSNPLTLKDGTFVVESDDRAVPIFALMVLDRFRARVSAYSAYLKQNKDLDDPVTEIVIDWEALEEEAEGDNNPGASTLKTIGELPTLAEEVKPDVADETPVDLSFAAEKDDKLVASDATQVIAGGAFDLFSTYNVEASDSALSTTLTGKLGSNGTTSNTLTTSSGKANKRSLSGNSTLSNPSFSFYSGYNGGGYTQQSMVADQPSIGVQAPSVLSTNVELYDDDVLNIPLNITPSMTIDGYLLMEGNSQLNISAGGTLSVEGGEEYVIENILNGETAPYLPSSEADAGIALFGNSTLNISSGGLLEVVYGGVFAGSSIANIMGGWLG